MKQRRNIYQRFIVFVCVLVSLMGCDNLSTKPEAAVATVAVTPSPPEIFSQTPSSTSNDLLVQTPVASSMPNTFIQEGINEHCLKIESGIQPGIPVEGVLAFSRDDLLLDLHSKELKPLQSIDSGFAVDHSVSPDGQWLAHIENYYDQFDHLIDRQLRIMGPNGNLLQAFHLDDDWQEIAWLDNDFLIFEQSGRLSGAVALLNLNTGEWEEHLPSFPNIFDIYGTTPNPKWIQACNPTLSHVAYISNATSNGNNEAILWNLTANKIVGTINHWSGETVPKWSPDGKQLAIVADGVDRFREEIFIVTQAGDETKVTNLAAAYPIVFIEMLNWSPDGRFIAFLMEGRQSNEESGSRQLMILDMLTNQVTDYCLGVAESLPYWAPNGHQFVLNRISEDGSNQVILIDIDHESAAQIIDDVSVTGWLVSPAATGSYSQSEPLSQAPIDTTPIPFEQVDQECLKIEPEFSTAQIAENSVVFSKDLELVVLNSQAEDVQLLPEFPAMAPSWQPLGFISPNGKWLAYEIRKDTTENFLFLTTVDGKQQLSIPWPLEQRQEALLGWLDDERLVFLSGLGDQIIFYNPFTSQQTDGTFSYNLTNPFSDLANQYPQDECYHCPASQWPNSLSMIHDPTLTRLVYLSAPGQNNEAPSVVLKNLENGQELWRFTHWDTFQQYPKWAPNGEQMAIALPIDEAGKHYELFSVTRDGQVAQLTDLISSYPVFVINGFTWSPNSRYIAFWADIRQSDAALQQNAYRLFVFDLVEQRIVDYCIPGFFSYTPSPEWSPDSQQLLVYSYSNAETSSLVLVDINQNSAAQVGEDLTVIGWMTSEP